jgi:hypothetical protein
VDETSAGGPGGDGDGTFTAATWLSTGVLVAGDIASAGTNGSVAGWGVDNNNFENTNELFFFDFGSQATSDPDAGGPFVPPVQGPDVAGDPPEVQMPNISFATFEFINYTSGAGNAGDDIAYVVHYTDGTFASGFVPAANIDGALWTHTAPAGKFIADIQFFAGLEPDLTTSQDLPPGKIDLVSVGVQSTSLDVDLDFTVTLTDYDGDQVTGSFTINVDQGNTESTPEALSLAVVSQEPIVDSSAFSLMSSDSTEQQRTMSYANNNSVLLGAIAAAGLGAGSQAAAHNFATGGHDMLFDTTSFGYVGGDAQGLVLDNIDTVRSALGGETIEIVGYESFADTSSHRSAVTEKLSLTDGAGDATMAPTALLQGTEVVHMDPAQSTLTSAAVGMPSAEMFVLGSDGHGVVGAPQSNGEVGRVLMDALAGGGGGPNIDAVLDAVANGAGGGNAALEAIASLGGGDVSPWHMADFAGYSAIHSAIMMETMALHPDAIQTAA